MCKFVFGPPRPFCPNFSQKCYQKNKTQPQLQPPFAVVVQILIFSGLVFKNSKNCVKKFQCYEIPHFFRNNFLQKQFENQSITDSPQGQSQVFTVFKYIVFVRIQATKTITNVRRKDLLKITASSGVFSVVFLAKKIYRCIKILRILRLLLKFLI